jgi:hypothetical protein
MVRRRLHSAFPALATALASGCVTQLLPDGGAPGAADLSVPACITRTLVKVPLQSAEIYKPTGVEEPFQGRAVRIRIGYQRAPCDLPGPLDVNELGGDGSDTVTITAHVWRASPACAGAPVVEEGVLTLDDPAEILYTITDAVGGGNALLFKLPGPADFSGCARPPIMGFGPCTNDCECAKPWRCIADSAASGACQIPCNEDLDCTGSPTPLCPRALNRYECATSAASCSCSVTRAAEGPCPAGQSCADDGICACRVTARGISIDRQCSCDSDCSEGTICFGGGCRMPCDSARDCPAGFPMCNSGLCTSMN